MQEDLFYPIAIELQVYNALLLKFYNQALEERLHSRGENLSSLQFGILRMVQHEKLTISEISQRMGLDPSTLVRSIDALERKNLVRRGADPHDRRRNPIHITEKGVELILAVPVITGQDPVFQALKTLGLEPSIRLLDLQRLLIQQFPEGRLVSGLISGQQGSQDNYSNPADPQ